MTPKIDSADLERVLGLKYPVKFSFHRILGDDTIAYSNPAEFDGTHHVHVDPHKLCIPEQTPEEIIAHELLHLRQQERGGIERAARLYDHNEKLVHAGILKGNLLEVTAYGLQENYARHVRVKKPCRRRLLKRSQKNRVPMVAGRSAALTLRRLLP